MFFLFFGTLGGLKSKSFIKQTPPKVVILIENTIWKFSKTKNQTQKRPPKVPKNKKNMYKEASNQKVLQNTPPKSGNSDSKYNLKFSKTKNQTQKRPPKVPKIKNIYKEASNQKVFKNQKFNSKRPPKVTKN